jgi:hypothetical protein
VEKQGNLKIGKIRKSENRKNRNIETPKTGIGKRKSRNQKPVTGTGTLKHQNP